MNTPAHAILNLVVFERGQRSLLGPWVIAGAVIPDVPNMLFFAYHRFLRGLPQETIYGELYPSALWQSILAPWHSILVVALVMMFAGWRRSQRWLALGISAGFHLLCDALTHAADAHPHLWPLSDARVRSPVSYWDRAHYGALFVPVELAIVVVLSVLAWRRGDEAWRRVIVAGSCAWLALAYATGWAFWGSA